MIEISHISNKTLDDRDIARLELLESKAIKFIHTVRGATNQLLYAGNSSGKDSGVIDLLLQKSGIEYFSFHANTTIDPPGSLTFLKENYPHTEILKPNESFLQLVERKGFPTRLNRYCCESLKEYGSVGKMVFEGVRSAESKNRKGRDYIQCDSRSWQKGAQHIYPIYDWTDADVWDYIQFRNIPFNPNYKKGLKRIGCVACPLVKTKTRMQELALFPKFYDNLKRAIKRGMDKNPQWKLTVATNGNADIAMLWYLSGKTMNEFFTDIKLVGSKRDGWKAVEANHVQTKIFI